nr:hypothetical protein Iba_chr07bCG3360 [Ipomoea batatas]GMD15860.1 hypothetical protein Iba_chr07cCG3820 [Ipomoea batatas]GMD18857.1 hypothetical protein Iba_chr07eCG3210 [Ipomoea batatas]
MESSSATNGRTCVFLLKYIFGCFKSLRHKLFILTHLVQLSRVEEAMFQRDWPFGCPGHTNFLLFCPPNPVSKFNCVWYLEQQKNKIDVPW